MKSSRDDDRSKHRIPRLSELEWEIVKPLWEHGPMLARDIYRIVPRQYGWAYKTVKTMLARLVKKGVLTYEKIGKSYLYRAVYSRSEMARVATASFVQRVFDGATRPFLAYFAESVSQDDLKQLKDELTRIEKEKPSRHEEK